MIVVVIIEDNDAMVRPYIKMLKLRGYEVIHFGAGEPLLSYIESHDNKIDLLIVDIGLPGIDGVDLSIEVRSRGYSGPIIAMSGAVDLAQVRLNAVDFFAKLQKPFMQQELLDLVRGATSHLPQPSPAVEGSKVDAKVDQAKAAEKKVLTSMNCNGK